MLHAETVPGETFALLNSLMRDEHLCNFSLAGGTALALYMGHRISIDLDLFTATDFNAPELEKYLVDTYNFEGDYSHINTLKGVINGVRIDCITHSYPHVSVRYTEGDIRLYSLPDIVAMKLSVIADNGSRLKDFIDIAFLSTKMSLSSMLDAYEFKYKNANRMRPVKGLTYYDDILFQEPIQMIKGTYKWNKIEKRLQQMIKFPDRLFLTTPI